MKELKVHLYDYTLTNTNKHLWTATKSDFCVKIEIDFPYILSKSVMSTAFPVQLILS